ncbi:MAG: alpha/beta fold hydrolase, partial [Actinobacteria bacterium]|nr:alpha/beta fold hydrolase [Actinomycetota bacterium]
MAVPKVEYAKDGDLHVAYQVWGDGPIDLVLVWGLFSHCELFWEDPPMARFLEALGRFARVIQFDKRGTGMSDAVPGVPTLEQRMDDLRIVMDAVGSERAAIFGESEGGPMSCLFAATFPERVSHLILFGPLLRLIGDDTFQFAFSPAVFEQWLEAMVDTWGTGVMMAVAAPSRQDQAAAMELSGRFERIALNRGAFRDLMLANARMDIRPVLPTISVPTMVLHRAHDGLVNIEQGRYAASQIPGARLVEMPGPDHYVAAGDADGLLGEMRSFLTGGDAEADLDIDRVLST